MIDEPGRLYVAHFEPAYRHARHYIGWASVTRDRWDCHLAGNGSPLIRAALAAGCAVTFHDIGGGTRSDERRLHNRHDGAKVCPTCRPRIEVSRVVLRLHPICICGMPGDRNDCRSLGCDPKCPTC